MPPDALPDIVVPTEPGLHLLIDRPQGPGAPLILGLAAHAIDQGIPVVPILLDQATPQFRANLARHGVDLEGAEARGHIAYVDAFAPRVGWAHTDQATIFAEAPGPDSILLALSEAQAGIVEHAPHHLVLVDSFSTLLVLEGLPATYAFAQALSSLAPRLGAITAGRIVADMHGDQERTSLLHLATTVTDLRDQAETSAGTRRPRSGAKDAKG